MAGKKAKRGSTGGRQTPADMELGSTAEALYMKSNTKALWCARKTVFCVPRLAETVSAG